MSIAIFLLLAATAIISDGDVIRTVFCRKHCTDYLKIPETLMPLCTPEHLQLKECGTVISCDWAEADRDKVRPVANSSDFLCCYQTAVKEKGDCVEQLATELEPVQLMKSVPNNYGFYFLSWILCFSFIVIAILQAAYIVKLRISGPKHQKIGQSNEINCPQFVIPQPLVGVRHFDDTVSSRLLRADDLPFANMAATGNIPSQ
ncbi:hypothetical protein KIN20_000796 [Parelaphostrongylus tenuis]|uniref:Transmembrane protein n=1 Tax=Parelaphostrongylus tenuis TaxID=148309 RepID=A0AAD5QE40_PARTN|nr:hypothetical protein KIN20_000796 [Parelaphostrongylus tenuis]